MYENGLYRYNDEGLCLQKVREYRDLLKGEQIVYHHGDYHVGNILVDQKGQLRIIDFDRTDTGEAYEEFNRITWCVSTSHAFASGRVNGYFDGSVPAYFWKILKLYILNNALSSLPWGEDFGDEEIRVMRQEYQRQRDYYQDFTIDIPLWYAANINEL